MKKFLILLIPIALIAFSSCSDSTPQANELPSETTGAGLDSTKPKLTPEQWQERAAKNPEIVIVDNKTSPFKFTQTNAEFTLFGELIAGTDFAKILHNEDLILLCPSNEAIQRFGSSKIDLLKKPENRELLKNFISAHIIKPPFSVDKLDLITNVENYYGQQYAVDVVTRTVKGVDLGTYEVQCKIGKIVELDGVIDFPAKQLGVPNGKK